MYIYTTKNHKVWHLVITQIIIHLLFFILYILGHFFINIHNSQFLQLILNDIRVSQKISLLVVVLTLVSSLC